VSRKCLAFEVELEKLQEVSRKCLGSASPSKSNLRSSSTLSLAPSTYSAARTAAK